jgi:hypothetical protein
MWRSLRVAVTGKDPFKQAPPAVLAAPPQVLSKAEMEQGLAELMDRGVQLLHVFTGGNFRFNHRRQFAEAFPRLARRPEVRVEYLPGADHTFDRTQDQRVVIELIGGWLRSTRFSQERRV